MLDKLKGRFHGREDSSNQASQGLGAPPAYDDPSQQNRPTSAGKQTAPPSMNAEPAFRTNFASVSLHMADRIRLMGLRQEVCDAIRSSILRTWPNGLQDERLYHGSLEFKLRGYPWSPQGDDAIYARRVTRDIMSTLHHYGRVLYISTDISRNPGDKDSLFFRHQDPPPAPCEWFSFTFSKGDRIRLIDAPNELVQDMLATLRLRTQSHQPFRVPGVYEIKLKGYPFAASGTETMEARILVMELFAVLERHGFTVYASVDQKYGQEGMETDSWHVSRPVGWTRGAPVYHH